MTIDLDSYKLIQRKIVFDVRPVVKQVLAPSLKTALLALISEKAGNKATCHTFFDYMDPVSIIYQEANGFTNTFGVTSPKWAPTDFDRVYRQVSAIMTDFLSHLQTETLINFPETTRVFNKESNYDSPFVLFKDEVEIDSAYQTKDRHPTYQTTFQQAQRSPHTGRLVISDISVNQVSHSYADAISALIRS